MSPWDVSQLADAAYPDVAFATDRKALLATADAVLAVQPPAFSVIDDMKPNAILICFIEARAVNMATPAGGASIGVAPAGTWTCTSLSAKCVHRSPPFAAPTN